MILYDFGYNCKIEFKDFLRVDFKSVNPGIILQRYKSDLKSTRKKSKNSILQLYPKSYKIIFVEL